MQAKADRSKMNRLVIGANQLVNLLWSGLCLGPLAYYCYSRMNLSWFYTFLIVSFIPFLVPNIFFDRIQLGSSVGFYARLGIRTVRKYTQDGDLINQWLQRKFPAYSPTNRLSLQQHVGKSYLNEKFHVGCFVFFLLSCLYALQQGYWLWATTILVSNIVYNVYPILLQQYNRIRLTKLIQKRLVGKGIGPTSADKLS